MRDPPRFGWCACGEIVRLPPDRSGEPVACPKCGRFYPDAFSMPGWPNAGASGRPRAPVSGPDGTGDLGKKLADGTLTLDDLLVQIERLEKMGPMRELLAMIPGFGEKFDESDVKREKAMIRAMTAEERTRPEIIDGRRGGRIARGAGTEPKKVADLVGQFLEMKGEMKKNRGLFGLL